MENPRPRRSPESLARPGLWPLLLGGLLAGALLVAFVGSELRAMYHRYFGGHERPPPAVPIRDERARLAVLFQEAKNHIRESRWTEARALLLQMQAEAPDYPLLKDYLDRVEQEIPNQEHLKAAQAALTEQRLAAARAELDQITPDTTMFEQVNSLKRALRDAEDKQVEEAKALHAAGKSVQSSNALSAELRRQEAQRLYDRHFVGYRVRDGNPEDLIPIFREIMSLTPPEDELHQKSKAWLEKLSRD